MAVSIRAWVVASLDRRMETHPFRAMQIVFGSPVFSDRNTGIRSFRSAQSILFACSQALVIAITYGILDNVSLKSDLGGPKRHHAKLSSCRSNSSAGPDMASEAAAYRYAGSALCGRGNA